MLSSVLVSCRNVTLKRSNFLQSLPLRYIISNVKQIGSIMKPSLFYQSDNRKFAEKIFEELEKQEKNTRKVKSNEKGKEKNDQKDDKKNEEKPEDQKPGIPLFFYYLIAISLLLLYISNFGLTFKRPISWHQFEEQIIKPHLLSSVTFIDDTSAIITTKDSRELYISFPSRSFFDARLLESCDKANSDPTSVIFSTANQNNSIYSLKNVLIVLTITYIAYYISRRFLRASIKVSSHSSEENPLSDFFPQMRKNFNQFNASKSDVNFSDIRGCDEAKAEIREFVDFLKNPEKFESLGAKLPKGAVLYGPPGTGKTLLAKAVAGEAGVPFLFASGSEFIEMIVGVGAKRVRELFNQAKKLAPCIVFIDEIDAIGSRRGAVRSHSENDQTLNQLLCELDGFGTDSRVVLLCGTNRFHKLDPALIRPGRLDRKIFLASPSLAGRVDLFDLYLSKIKINQQIRNKIAGRLAGLTPGCTGADVASICNEGAIVAAREKEIEVSIYHLEQALDRLLLGNKLFQTFSPREKRTVALHESGHAVVAWFSKHCFPVLKISIVPRGNALGVNQFLPSEDKLMSLEQMSDMISAVLGGRAAEELIVGSISSGASDDLKKVTEIAYKQVCLFGMDTEVGLVHYPSIHRKLSEGGEYGGDAEYGPDMANKIDLQVKSIISTGYERAKQIIKDRRELVTKLANELCVREVLSNEEIENILGKRPQGSLTVNHILNNTSP